MSRRLFARPSEARTAPTATSGPRHRCRRGTEKPSPSESRQRAIRSASNRNAASAAPGLQKQPPRRWTPAAFARCSTRPNGTHRPSRSSTLKATVPPGRCRQSRAVDPDERSAVAMPQRRQPLEQLRRQLHDVAGEPRRPDAVAERETGVERGDVEKVGGAVLEAVLEGAQLVTPKLHRRVVDRAAGEPGPRERLRARRGARRARRRRSDSRTSCRTRAPRNRPGTRAG